MGIVTLLNVSMNVVYLKAIPVGELAGVERAAELAARRLFGSAAALVVAGAILASGFGCTSANIAPGPRVAFALAQDRLFPRAFGRVHARFGTPAFGLLVQALWTALLCLSGRYEELYTYSVFLGVLGYTAAAVSLFIFRRTRPEAPRPYRCWGYPVVPSLYVLGSLLFVVNTLVTQPKASLAGLLILALGVPVYFLMKSRRA
jgi:APA family basic amino acid/polyamine antiporter